MTRGGLHHINRFERSLIIRLLSGVIGGVTIVDLAVREDAELGVLGIRLGRTLGYGLGGVGEKRDNGVMRRGMAGVRV